MGMPQKIFDKLCEEDEKLTSTEALWKAIIFEAKFQLSASTVEKDSINYVSNKARGQTKPSDKKSNSGYKNNSSKGKYNNSGGNKGKTKKKACAHCGWHNHETMECKYKNSKCHNCGKIGHLASICRDKLKKVNYVSENKYNVYCI